MKQEHLNMIREFCPEAPRLGAKVKIFLGTARTEGRDHHCVVRGPQDKAKPAVVTGYALEFAESAGVWPKGPETVSVLVTVRLNRTYPLIKGRVVTAHVSCLECVPSKFSSVSPERKEGSNGREEITATHSNEG